MLSIDHYGNLRLNARAVELRERGITIGQMVTIRIGEHTIRCAWQQTFGDALPGAPVLLEDSYWRLCVAINRGDASQTFGAAPGTPVVMTWE